jgi:cyclophilin family peptidyl-prolyl cis-trans isomerase
MNIFFKQFLSLSALLFLISCNEPGGNENTIVSIRTTMGEIKIKLYDGTPLHRNNFINLVNSGLYDGVSFHRVIKDFMIQAGDPATRTGLTKEQMDTLHTYTIPAELRKEYFHKKGALAAAREGNNVNPEMRSSGTQFYIVQGIKYTDEELMVAEGRINSSIKQNLFSKLIKETADSARLSGVPLQDSELQERASMKMFNYLTINGDYKFSADQINAYKTIGGTPRLDGTYTVFGEVIEGLDIVDRIAASTTDGNDTPLTDIKITKMKVVSK